MNLTFDNLAELNEFLGWAKQYAASVAPDLTANRAREPIGPDTPHPAIDVAFDTPPASDLTKKVWPSGAAAEVADKTLEQSAEPAKRKRRTKAEIEADAAKAASGHVDIARTVHADGSVTTTSVGLPPDVDSSDVEMPEGTNPFEQAAAPAADPAAPAGDTPAADGDEPAVVTPFQHLTRGREFIAKHGMPKYLETFTKAGTDPNVMGYSAYQRGLHMAAMDELDKA